MNNLIYFRIFKISKKTIIKINNITKLTNNNYLLHFKVLKIFEISNRIKIKICKIIIINKKQTIINNKLLILTKINNKILKNK
jgi:hypothetical protein